MSDHMFRALRIAQGVGVLCLLIVAVATIFHIRGVGAAFGNAIFADDFEDKCSVFDDFDEDGVCDAVDPDDDNDGTPDVTDPCPFDPFDECVTVDPCDHPRVNPAGLFGVDRQWGQVWSSTNGNYAATFPNSAAGVVAVGANVGTYLSAGFIYPPNLTWTVTWDQAQPNNQYGYSPERRNNGGMFIGFSKCRGDLRQTDQSSPYSWLRPACRRFATANGITLTTRTDLPAHICRIPAGENWLMTVAAGDPSTDPAINTCNPPSFTNLGLGCDVQALHRSVTVLRVSKDEVYTADGPGETAFILGLLRWFGIEPEVIEPMSPDEFEALYGETVTP